MKLFMFILMSVLWCDVFCQNTLNSSEPLFDLEFKGAILSNKPVGNTEYFGQYRTVLVGLRLSEQSKIKTGISVARVENNEVLELPLIYQYQATEALSLYSGAQMHFVRGVQSSNLSTKQLESSFIMGIDYQFNTTWDSGVQFVVPINETNNILPQNNVELSQPIRFRTGVKF